MFSARSKFKANDGEWLTVANPFRSAASFHRSGFGLAKPPALADDPSSEAGVRKGRICYGEVNEEGAA
jgi:hypothetical protein